MIANVLQAVGLKVSGTVGKRCALYNHRRHSLRTMFKFQNSYLLRRKMYIAVSRFPLA